MEFGKDIFSPYREKYKCRVLGEPLGKFNTPEACSIEARNKYGKCVLF